MARLFVLCALIGAALAVPTPQTLPKTVLGVWESIPSESKNFEEFVTVFGLPKHAKFDRNNLIGFWKEGDTYYQRFAYWPTTLTFDLPFKLGETQTTTILGKHFEYVYTLETGATPETPVLRVKFRQTDGDAKFTVEAAFTKDGRITATYTRDNVVAKRTYRRTLPPYVLGFFETDPSSITDEALAFSNQMIPLPGGLKWTKNSHFWLGREEGSDKFVEKMMVDPTYYWKMTFNFDEPITINHNGETVKATYTILETNTTHTTLRHEVTCSKGTIVGTSVFDRKGVRCTMKTNDNKEFTSYHKRTLPGLYYGTFEEVPEKTENWEEFMKNDEGCKMSDAVKKYTIYRKSAEEFGVRKVLNGTQNFDVSLKIDGLNEVKLPNGKDMKVNVSLVNGNETLVVIRAQSGDKKFTFEKKVKPCGIAETYRRGDVVAKKYFRRVVPKTVFGTFEAQEVQDAEFKKWATEKGMGEWLQKATFELNETPDHKFTKKITVEGQQPKEHTFALGEPVEFKTPNNKHGKGRQFFYIADNKPVLRSMYYVEDKLVFQIVSIFNPTGFDATYIYGDQTNGGEKIFKRPFTRKGEAVPFDYPPTN